MNCTLMEKAHSMLQSAKVPNQFWAVALANANYVRNRSPTVALNNITPFEAYWGLKPVVKHLCIFGLQAYAFIPKTD